MNSSGMRANAVLLFMQPCPPKFTLKMTPDRARHLSGLTSETPMPLLMIATTLVAQTAAYWGNRLPAPGVFGRNPIEEATRARSNPLIFLAAATRHPPRFARRE